MNMEIYELPLVFFTVIAQWGIGGILAFTLCQHRFDNRWQKRIALGLWIITAAGSAASLAHLGSPGGAYRAVYGLGHSWLSREVLAFGALNALSTLWLLSVWRKPALMRLAGFCCSAAGAVAILVSVQVYAQMNLHPLWQFGVTAPAFLGCALLTGFASVSVLLNAVGQKQPALLEAGWLLGLVLIFLSLFWRYQLPGADGTSALLWWQVVASLIAGMAGLAWLRAKPRPVLAGGLLIALIVAGELAGRMLFYGNVMGSAPWF